jgi:hypothetical protein
LSKYDNLLFDLKEKGERLANQYIAELYNILREEEKLPPEDCRAKIEHDCIDLWSRATIRKYLPPETKDSKKQKAGKIGGQKREMLLIAAAAQQNPSEDARINLAENSSFIQNEEESSTFHNELNQRLSGRTPSPELLEATKIIADKDRKIEELKKDREELLKENPIRTNGILLFLSNSLAMDICNAGKDNIISSGTIMGFNLEHNGQEVTAVHQVRQSL